MKRKWLLFITIVLSTYIFAGCSHRHEWISASCFNPKTCIDCGVIEGEPLGHKWIEATCENPKHCPVCGTTEGNLIEHDWVEATCNLSKHCSVCSKVEGLPLQHKWTTATSTIPSKCLNCGEMKPLSLPKSGQIFTGASLYRDSELTIKSSTTDSCYIKLKSTAGKDVFSFFVKAGDSITVPVPTGYYYVYFSYGKEWYGPEHIFGPDTTYAKDDEILDFENYTWEYTLYPSYGGNFSETPIDAEEFK